MDVQRLSHNRFYQAYDLLVDQKEEIEAVSSDRERTLFLLEEKIILYDLTNTYFTLDPKRIGFIAITVHAPLSLPFGKFEVKGRSLIEFRFEIDTSPVFLNDQFCDAQPKTRSFSLPALG